MAFTALQLVNELLSRFGLKEVATIGQTADATLALRKINLAIQMISTAHPFVWAMKNDPGQLTAVDGTSTYALATDVAHVIAAKHVYQGGAPIKIIDRATLEQYRSDRTQSGDRTTPRFLAPAGVLQASASDTPQLRLEAWPVPDANFAGQIIYYFYTFKLTDLSAATDISLIPGDFHWLILEVAETLYRRGPIRTGGDGAQSQIDLFSIAERKAKEGMARLISRDSAVSGSEFSWEAEEANPSL
jgi:hypothetical protein